MGVPQQRQLFIDERGTSGDLTEIFIRCGDLTEIFIRCECGKAERSVAQAARFQDRALGNCDGSRPWLGPFTKESCGEPSRLLIRSAIECVLSTDDERDFAARSR